MRLDAIAAGKDGFELAEVDLAVRGEGEVLGTRQHGLPSFRVASLPEDAGLLLRARQLVAEWVRTGELDSGSDLLAPLVAEARFRYGDERRERIAA
jgi:ATP-dependent DNA helicase RecG